MALQYKSMPPKSDEAYIAPAEEVKLMDVVQKQSNRDIASLLPCDPCVDAEMDGIGEPEEAEPMDLGLGIEDELYEL